MLAEIAKGGLKMIAHHGWLYYYRAGIKFSGHYLIQPLYQDLHAFENADFMRFLNGLVYENGQFLFETEQRIRSKSGVRSRESRLSSSFRPQRLHRVG